MPHCSCHPVVSVITVFSLSRYPNIDFNSRAFRDITAARIPLCGTDNSIEWPSSNVNQQDHRARVMARYLTSGIPSEDRMERYLDGVGEDLDFCSLRVEDSSHDESEFLKDVGL